MKQAEFLSVQEKICQDRYLVYLNDCINQQKETVDSKTRRVHEERELLQEKMKDRKILSTLKEKKQQTFEETQRQKEQKNLDEMAVAKFYQTT